MASHPAVSYPPAFSSPPAASSLTLAGESRLAATENNFATLPVSFSAALLVRSQHDGSSKSPSVYPGRHRVPLHVRLAVRPQGARRSVVGSLEPHLGDISVGLRTAGILLCSHRRGSDASTVIMVTVTSSPPAAPFHRS